MSEQLQLRRGTAAQIASFTGAQGEIAVDTTNNRLVVQDGATAGGFPAAKLSEVGANTRTPVSDAAYTVLATDRLVAYTALTAARIVTLPAAASYPTGVLLMIVDETGACSATITITVNRVGSDTLGGTASFVIDGAYGGLEIESNGSNAWTILSPRPNLQASLVGVGTAPDPNNVISAYGASALFNGAANFNVTVNKAATADTASFIFEDGFSGRAQIGLCGDDNFHFKVSPDGSTWRDALTINAATGQLTATYGFAQWNYLGGLNLSNDATSSPTVLDIEAGTATDSTNTVVIQIGAFTKSTAGAWAAGSGSNGMGNGLTIAPSTGYHVCLAYNGGTPDIWFDTSATGANKPTGISGSYFRRIGSFKTDASSNILAFTQKGDIYLWKVPPADVNVSSLGTTSTNFTLSVPSGVVVQAKIWGNFSNTNARGLIYSPLQGTQAVNASAGQYNLVAANTSFDNQGIDLAILTNTSGQIAAVSSAASTQLQITTYGYIDARGKDN